MDLTTLRLSRQQSQEILEILTEHYGDDPSECEIIALLAFLQRPGSAVITIEPSRRK